MTSQSSNMPHGLSFGACGFLISYQIGAAEALKELVPALMSSLSKVYGSSSGSIVATVIACDCDLGIFKEQLFKITEATRRSILNRFSPISGIYENMKKALIKSLPENSYQKANGKLCISLTRVLTLQNVLVSEYSSNEDVVEAVLCSCFIPGTGAFMPPKFRGVRYIDGGFSSMLACCDSKDVITISGFAGDTDICPKESPVALHVAEFGCSTFQFTLENFVRSLDACFPPSRSVNLYYHSQGYRDAVAFLLTMFGVNRSITGLDKNQLQELTRTGPKGANGKTDIEIKEQHSVFNQFFEVLLISLPRRIVQELLDTLGKWVLLLMTSVSSSSKEFAT